jgi:3-hydroxymyristoyl/3-hydroxydecanoyl-(acyl carrier protein) dehydratase
MRFVLVDRIHSLEPGVRVVASRLIPPDDDYFADHFPGFPVVPGVLLTEMMGQAAAKALDVQRGPRGKAMLAQKDAGRAQLEFMNAAKVMPKDAAPQYQLGLALLVPVGVWLASICTVEVEPGLTGLIQTAVTGFV